MSFEDDLIKNAERNREELSPLMRRAYAMARDTFDVSRIDMEDFRDLYGEDQVEADMESAKALEEKYRKERSPIEERQKQISEILEAIIINEGEMSEWFGPNATTFKTSRHDDLRHGTDVIVEIDEEGKSAQQLALAVDVTFGDNSTLDKKFKRIVEEVKKGELGTVKYFKSEHGFEGRLTRVPHVVIGLEKGNVEKLSELWVNKNRSELAIHPARNLILKEIKLELEALMEVAREAKKPMAVSSIERALRVVDDIISGYGDGEDLGDLETDRVLRRIQDLTGPLRRST